MKVSLVVLLKFLYRVYGDVARCGFGYWASVGGSSDRAQLIFSLEIYFRSGDFLPFGVGFIDFGRLNRIGIAEPER